MNGRDDRGERKGDTQSEKSRGHEGNFLIRCIGQHEIELIISVHTEIGVVVIKCMDFRLIPLIGDKTSVDLDAFFARFQIGDFTYYVVRTLHKLSLLSFRPPLA